MVIIFAVGMSATRVLAINKKELETQSNLIARLLVSCRAVIAQNQNLFNNAGKGDKGFAAEVYINKVKDHYKNATGIEVSESDASSADSVKKTLGTLLVSAKDIIDESQDVLNTKGKGFKNIIPVVVGRRASYKYSRDMGYGYYLKQTSMKFRNPSNHPDPFEVKVLIMFEGSNHQKGKGIGEVIAFADGSKIYRYMLPVYIEPQCLVCHGDPKGEKDMAGKIKEGYKLGELRGAISVVIPLPSEELVQEK
ncbi:MAG: DUF3365 domain-containing protein [Candidatus Scalindua sp.]|nr:DUF3365 domain-containing protein [Candidatus Scalindua sp.]